MPAHAKILDIGCRSGVPIARYFLNQGFSVTGVDGAPEMIALFQSNLSTQETVVGDMRTLALERQYGGLVAWDSFFHLSPDDQRDMFRVFQKHALPLAALMFTSGPMRGALIPDNYPVQN